MFYFVHAALPFESCYGMNVVIEEVSELLNSTHGVAAVPIEAVLRSDTRTIEVQEVPVDRRVIRRRPVEAVGTSTDERLTLAAASSGEENINTMV